MKVKKLLLLALLPGILGWLTNTLLFLPVLGSLLFYVQGFAAAGFCLWLGRACARSGRSYPLSLLLTQWPGAVSLALYLWQFHFTSDAARNSFLAVLSQCQGIPLLSLATKFVWHFAGNSWGPPQTLAAFVISLALLAVLFSGGYIWGRKCTPASAA